MNLCSHSEIRLDGLWATWSSGNCPCPWQGPWSKMIFKVICNSNHSRILSFYLGSVSIAAPRRNPTTNMRTCLQALGMGFIQHLVSGWATLSHLRAVRPNTFCTPGCHGPVCHRVWCSTRDDVAGLGISALKQTIGTIGTEFIKIKCCLSSCSWRITEDIMPGFWANYNKTSQPRWR